MTRRKEGSPRTVHGDASIPIGTAILLAALGAIGPFATDTYLPSFLDIASSLNVSTLEVQQTLTAYMVPFSVMALWHGAISDALGRRRVIIVAQVLFAAASLGCVFATRIETLWILRAVQGVAAGAGIVVSRAIVRDLFQGPAAQRLMSHIAMMFALAPAIAPMIGGRLQSWFGWRSIFVFLTLATGLLAFVCWARLPETLPKAERQSLNPGYLARTYWKVMTSPVFLTACGAIAFNGAGFFLYVMSAPQFLMRHLGVAETGFLWLFGPAMLGLVSGSWYSGKIAARLSPERTLLRSYYLAAFASVLNVLINGFVPPSLPWTVLPIPIYTFAMALSMPTLTLQAIDPFPEQRGLAASCQMFLQAASNAVVAGIVAPALWGSTFTMACGMTAAMLLGGASTTAHFFLTRPARRPS
jgi:DHA1 family bicyclomycin/chloramphenicol resistance-like MFS transporter